MKVNVKAPMRGPVCSGSWFDGMDSIVSEKVVKGRCSWSVYTHSQEGRGVNGVQVITPFSNIHISTPLDRAVHIL